MTPDYIIIGAMKSGTSTLCAYFEDHPGTFMVPHCEPNYFNEDENFAQGPEWYGAHFADAAPGQLLGEGSNGYSNGARYPETAARMAAMNPKMKIIYIAREPVSRIASAWVQNRINLGDLVPATLDGAVHEQPEVFLDQSLYWKNLQLYRAAFPDDQIHLCFMEDLKADPQALADAMCDFLGVARAEIARPHQNKGDGKKVPTPGWARLKQMPGVGALRNVVPRDTRIAMRTAFFSRDAKEVAAFSPETRAWVMDQLREDSAAFLAHAGKPADFWSLA